MAGSLAPFSAMKGFIQVCILLSLGVQSDAIRCFKGTFRSNNICKPCPQGTWNNQINADACIPCKDGQTTIAEGVHNINLCISCPSGTYSSGGRPCQPCPTGTTSLKGSTKRAHCLSCGPGFELGQRGQNQNKCQKCSPGTFSTTARVISCTRCPSDTSSAAGATSCMPGICPPGKEQSGPNRCSKCFRTQVKETTSAELCRECPMGTFPNDSQTACIPCPLKFFRKSQFATKCKRCPPGTTTLGVGSTSCRRQIGPCPSNTVQTKNLACVACPLTERLNPETGLCERCPKNHISSGPGSTKCTRCPKGTIPDGSDRGVKCVCGRGLGRQKDGTCAPCPPGTDNRSGGDTCSPCFEGDVKSGTDTKNCRSCPSGTFPSEDASNCLPCPKGFTSSNGPDLLFFSNIAPMNTDVCRSEQSGCPMGFELDGTFEPDRFTECAPSRICTKRTPPGAPCRKCKIGYRRDSPQSCSECPSTSTSDGVVCRKCPPGFAVSVEFETEGICVCPEGKGVQNGICSTCLPGTASREGETCKICPAGTFAKGIGNRDCKNCPPDSFTNKAGSDTCTMCPAGYFTYGLGETECLKFKV